MRDSKLRTSWRRSKGGAGQERRAAGKAGERDYEVLPVTAARTGTGQKRVAANPNWHLSTPQTYEQGCIMQQVPLLPEERQDLVHILWGCTATTAPVPSGEDREGVKEVMSFFLNRFKINTHHSNSPPYAPGCQSLSLEMRTHRVPILCAPDHAAVAGFYGSLGVSQSVWMPQGVLSRGWTGRAKAYPGAIALTRC